MSIKAKTIEHYISQLPAERQEVISYLVATIKDVLPESELSMEQGIPVFIFNGMDIIAVAAQKFYYSIYLWNMDWKKNFRKESKRLNLGKGCIRFKTLDELPEEMLREIIKQAGQRS